MENSEIYLRAIYSMVARQTFPPADVEKIVGRDKQVEAYNLCDGSRSQTQVAAEVGLDKGNFSKTLARWVDQGILIRITDGKEMRPLHLYPLPSSRAKEG
jgi:DNA-binding MarR family transcriptional regulator